MGTLIGHIVPGSFFLIFSTWWSWNIFARYFQCHFEEKLFGRCKVPYKNSCSFLWKRNSDNKAVPLESWLKLTAIFIGIAGEFFTGFDSLGRFELHNGQHMIMFGFFAINPIFELMYFYKVPAIPPQLDYVSAIVALVVEGFLFKFHLEGRNHIDHQVHTFLIYIITLCCLSGIGEMMRPFDIRPGLGRSAFTFLQGSWFIHMGFILYPPYFMEPWDFGDHQSTMLVTILFTGHIASVLIIMFMIGLLVYKSERAKLGNEHAFEKLDNIEDKLLDNENVTKLSIESDSDDLSSI